MILLKSISLFLTVLSLNYLKSYSLKTYNPPDTSALSLLSMKLPVTKHKKVLLLLSNRQNGQFGICWTSLCILSLQNHQYQKISHPLLRPSPFYSSSTCQNAKLSLYRNKKSLVRRITRSQKRSQLGHLPYFFKPSRSVNSM